MASILLFEDKTHLAEGKTRLLQADGHTVQWVQGVCDSERSDNARQQLRASKWDFIVLDIALEDQFGGIHIYNQLVAGEYRKRWRNTLIWSIYTGPRIREAVYGEYEYPIRLFVETANIPLLNIFTSGTAAGGEGIKTRITELMKLPDDRCHVCGGELTDKSSEPESV